MKKGYIAFMLLATTLLAGCSVDDGDMDDQKMMAEGEFFHQSPLGTYTGEWSMVDNKGNGVAKADGPMSGSYTGPVTVQVDNPYQDEPTKRRITVSAMPLGFIDYVLYSINYEVPPATGGNASEYKPEASQSCSFLAELNGVSSDKLIYDLTPDSRCLLSYYSPLFERVFTWEYTYMKSAQCLCTLAYNTLDIYLPIESIAFDHSGEFLHYSDIPLRGAYTMVLHVERVK